MSRATTYKLIVFYDSYNGHTVHSGISLAIIKHIEKAMRKRKVIILEGQNNTCMIDFSKIHYAMYEKEDFSTENVPEGFQ